MTEVTISIPETELRALRGAFNSSYNRKEKGELEAMRGQSPFNEWLFRRAIIPLLLEINYDVSKSETTNVEVQDRGTIDYELAED